MFIGRCCLSPIKDSRKLEIALFIFAIQLYRLQSYRDNYQKANNKNLPLTGFEPRPSTKMCMSAHHNHSTTQAARERAEILYIKATAGDDGTTERRTKSRKQTSQLFFADDNRFSALRNERKHILGRNPGLNLSHVFFRR